MTSTATIRVPQATRDRLANLAHMRHMSLSTMLTDLAWQLEREDMFASERAAMRSDARNPEAMAELGEWEATLDDGIG